MLNTKKASLLALTVLLFSASSLFAQGSRNGQIKGTVIDNTLNEPLIGVNVGLQGTSIGSPTDIDGKFLINRVPVGTYTLVASSIGYKTFQAEIQVTSGQTLEFNITLEQEAVEGEEVIVSAQAQGQREAINQQIQSDNIVNVVSETKIQELPDFNAASALGRLPGVSTTKSSGEDNKVVIRGLSPKYNSIEVEGVKLSATGSSQIGLSSNPGAGSGGVSNDRSVDLTMVSPYMIRMIEVYKSLTPDMNANSIGGTVNMELREAPDEMQWSAMYQQGYTAKSNTLSNYRGVLSGSNRFLNKKLGVYLLGNFESYDRNADNLGAGYGIASNDVDSTTGYRPVKVNSVSFGRHIETRNRAGGNLILDYRLPKGSIKVINMYAYINSDYIDHNQSINYDQGRMDWSIRQGENVTSQRMHSFKVDYNLDFVEIDLSASFTSAGNVQEKSPQLSLNQTNALTGGKIRDNLKPEEVYDQLYGSGVQIFRGDSLVKLRGANLFSNDYSEEKFTYKADFKFPFNIGTAANGYFKVGGIMENQSNATDQETPYLAFGGDPTQDDIQGRMMAGIENRFGLTVDAEGDLPGYYFASNNNDLFDPFLNDRYGSVYYATNPGLLTDVLDYIIATPEFNATNNPAGGNRGGWYDGPYQQLTNDYEYGEDYFATYAMAKLNFSDFMVIGGARYEKVDHEYFAYNARDQRNSQSQIMYDTTSTNGNEFLLPMGQVKYSPFDWVDIRYAYTQTLSRPDYSQLSPKFTVTQGNQVFTGNPDLKPAKAYNQDINLTFHANKLGLFSIGYFHKRIENFVYTATYRIDAAEGAGIDEISNYQLICNQYYRDKYGAEYPDILSCADGENLITPQSNANVIKPLNNPNSATVRGIELDFQTSFWYLPKPLNNTVFGINYARIYSQLETPYYDVQVDLTQRPPVALLTDSSYTSRLVDQPNHVLNAYIGYDYKGFSTRLSFLFQANSATNNGGRNPEYDGYIPDYFRMDFSARQKIPFGNSEVFFDISNLNGANTSQVQRSIKGYRGIQNYGLTANMGLRLRF